MASRIHVLSQSTIDKIAAGEVVERPASVVKELVENSLDAGASRITVEIAGGGISLLRVTDNGCGISAEDLPYAFLRHATSKIEDVKDLHSLTSLGFRGEALSSIAAVSRVEVITKRAEDMTASRYLIEGGREKDLFEIGAPDGTSVVMRDLFFNTPARGKFLKSAATEAAHVGAIVEQLILSNPDVAFTYIANGQTKLSSSGSGKLSDAVYHIYGRDLAQLLIPIYASDGELLTEGLIGKPQVSRGNRNFENYYVNGRYVKSRIVSRAIEDGYGTKLMQHQYPFACFKLEISPEAVDVNVHPTKMDVRFSDEKRVYEFVRNAVEQTLKGLDMTLDAAKAEALSGKRIPGHVGGMAAAAGGLAGSTVGGLAMGEAGSLTGGAVGGLAGGAANGLEMGEAGSLTGGAVGGLAGGAANGLEMGEAGSLTDGAVSGLEDGAADGAAGKTDGTAAAANGAADFAAGKTDGTAVAANGAADDAADKTGGTAVSAGGSSGGKKARVMRPAEPFESAQILKEQSGADAGADPSPLGMSDRLILSHLSMEEQKHEAAYAGASLIYDEAEPGKAGKPEYVQETFAPRFLSKEAKPFRRIIGAIFDTYWIAGYGDKVFVFDQHAAHERVLFEKFMKQYESREISSQQLSPPWVVTLEAREEALLLDYMSAFEELGFEIEHFGERDYAVRAVPYALGNLDSEVLFHELLDQLEVSPHITDSRRYIKRVATEACKAAVKGGGRLSQKEAEQLLDDLMACEDPYHCPHGRPTILSFSKQDVEKRFKRIV